MTPSGKYMKKKIFIA